jgi:hypothetical protein
VSLTWWANHGSVVKHATYQHSSIAVCGAVLHRRARQVGSNSYPARPCKRCMPHLSTALILESLKGHQLWTEDTPTPTAAARDLTIGSAS